MKTKKKKLGRPPKPEGGMVKKSCQFEPKMWEQFEELERQTGKGVQKIIREGGELIVKFYQRKGFKV